MRKNLTGRVRRAVDRVRRRLRRRQGLVDLTKSRASKSAVAELEEALGFLLRIPGIGRAAVIKPETLMSWVSGETSLKKVIDELDRRGKLIRGSNGTATRQVQIAGSRQRYYCFAVGASVGSIQKRSKPATEIEDNAPDDGRMARLRSKVANARDYAKVSRRPKQQARFESGDDDWSDFDDWDDKSTRAIAAVKTYGRPAQLFPEPFSQKKRD
jgi:regulator of extracellular matrix RemA (YlzA/DUF370 family)